MNLSACDFVVVSLRSGNPVGAFLLAGDAAAFVAWRTAQEGVHGGGYEVVNADGTALIAQPRTKQAIPTWMDGKQFVAIER